MDDDEYIARKLDSVASQAATTIGKEIVKIRSEASMHGRTDSSGVKQRVREILKEGFVNALHEMERCAFESNIPAQQHLQAAGDKLADELVARHGGTLFGNPAFARNAQADREKGEPALRSELAEEIMMVQEDMKRQMIGTRKHGQGHFVIRQNYGVVQIAGDQSSQHAQVSNNPQVLAILDEIERALPNLTLTDPAKVEAKGLIAALKSGLPGAAARATGAALNGILAGAGSALGEQLGQFLGFTLQG